MYTLHYHPGSASMVVHLALLAVGLYVAMLTAFYTFRALFVAFVLGFVHLFYFGFRCQLRSGLVGIDQVRLKLHLPKFLVFFLEFDDH